MSRRILAIVIAVVAAMTMASATSLGALTNVSLWGMSGAKQACSVADPSADVTFYDGTTLVSLTTLVLDQLLTTEADYVGLENLSGDCVEMRPVIVVIGDHDGDSGTAERVMARAMLEEISGTSDVTLPLNVADAYDDELDDLQLLDALIVDLTEVRLGFCPIGVDSCDPTVTSP